MVWCGVVWCGMMSPEPSRTLLTYVLYSVLSGSGILANHQFPSDGMGNGKMPRIRGVCRKATLTKA
jgi:hypothetical protein